MTNQLQRAQWFPYAERNENINWDADSCIGTTLLPDNSIRLENTVSLHVAMPHERLGLLMHQFGKAFHKTEIGGQKNARKTP